MPRAFLIKKKKSSIVVHGHDEDEQIIVSDVNKSMDDEELFPKTKKRKSYEAMATRLKNESQSWSSEKQINYDSGSESGCYSTSSRSPSPITAKSIPNESKVIQPPNYNRPHQFFHHSQLSDSATAAAMLDPLKLSPVQWMRPFIAPYLPMNFPYHHPYHQLSPETPYQQFGSSRSPYHHLQSRAEPPSPTYPCPISPYTPPPRDNHHKSQITDKRAKQLSSSPAPSTSSWSDVERCCSNDSSDLSIAVDDGSVKDGKQSSLEPRTTSSGRRRTSDSAGSARYQCPDCQKSYSTYSGLSKHQQFHCTTTNKRSFSCKYCEKVYLSLGALKMHIRTHTLPCKCNLCGKAFSRPWLLQGHIRTHTGEKPFSCSHCNRAFADRSNLRAHLQTHSDVKKYSCKMCSKTFSRMSLLVKHEDGNCCQTTNGVQ